MTFHLKYTEIHCTFYSDTRYDLTFHPGNVGFQPPLLPIPLKFIQRSNINYEFTGAEMTRGTKGNTYISFQIF